MSRKRSTATRRSESQAASARAAAIRAEQERKERRRRSLIVTGVVAAVLVLVLAVATALISSKDDTTDTPTGTPAGAIAGLAVPAGKASAPVKVTVYEDFICPYCGQFEAAGRTAFAQDIAAGKVQFQYHVLDFLDDHSTTDYSTRAANALAVVLDTSGPTVAKRFHDLVFENQPEEGGPGLSDARLVALAVQAGATGSKVQPGIDGLDFKPWVARVTDQASKDKVVGTPTVKVDGRQIQSPDMKALAAAVGKAIDAGQ